MILDLVLKCRGIAEQGAKSLSLRIYTVKMFSVHDLPIFRSHELRHFETFCRPLGEMMQMRRLTSELI